MSAENTRCSTSGRHILRRWQISHCYPVPFNPRLPYVLADRLCICEDYLIRKRFALTESGNWSIGRRIFTFCFLPE